MSTYNENIPQPTQSLGETQPGILQNMMDIKTFADQDHVAIGTAGQGKHSKIRLPQGSAVTTAADEGALYTKDLSGTDEPQLFYRYQSDGTELQMTQGASTIAATGDIFIPGGLRMKWGTFTAGGATGTVTFASPFPTAIFQVQIVPETNGTSVFSANPYTLLAGSFMWRTTNSSAVHYWLAIGN